MKITRIEVHLIRVPFDMGAAPTAFAGMNLTSVDSLFVRGSQLAEGLRFPDHGHRPVQYLNNVLEQDHRAIKRRGRASQHFRSFWGAWRTIRRLRSDSYDPQRSGVLECGGCEGRSAAPLHFRSMRGDELNFQSPRPTFASTKNLQHFPLNPLAKAKRLAYTRSHA